MQQPTKAEFHVRVREETGVDVLFKPTNSHYSFGLLADPDDIDKYGPLSPGSVRHAGAIADTDRYDGAAVERMAHELAVEAVRHWHA